MTKEHKEWLATLPPNMQELATKYPPGRYKIKAGAPYMITCPGSLVTLDSYYSDGAVSVILFAKDKLPQAIEHERRLCQMHGTNDDAIAADLKTPVDPQWLEPVMSVQA